MPLSGLATTARKVQLGQETTWGTAVAATALLGGVTDASVKVMDETENIEELGRYGPSSMVIEGAQWAEASIEGIATYQDLIYYLHGILGTVSPSGAGPYVYTYTAPTASAAAAQKYTMEFGIGSSAYKIAGALFTKLTIKCQAKKYWTVSAELFGKTIATVTFASLNDRTQEGIRAADTVLKIDAVGGTIGTTSVATTLIDFELVIETGRHSKFFIGSAAPGDYGESRMNATLKTTMEFNSSAKAYFDALIAPALVQRQIELTATSGTNIAKLQFAGNLDGSPVELFGDRDGNAVVEYNWKANYNSTLGNWLKAIVTNSVASLT